MTENKTLTLPAKLKKASIGKASASIGFEVSKENMTVAQAEHFFVGARLQATITNNFNPEQPRLQGMEPDKLNTVVDVKRYTSGTETFTGTIVFSAGDIDVHRLADFAQSTVQLIAERIGEAGADTPEEETAAA